MNTRTAIILIFREEARLSRAPHSTAPFDGIEVAAVRPVAPGADYEDVIGPLREQHPGAKFHIEEI